MKLNYEQITSICQGCVRTENDDTGVRLYRFTKEQEEVYKTVSSDAHEKTFATAGIKLLFETNSKSIFLRIGTTPGSSRSYFSVDVVVDGTLVDSLDNFSDFVLPQDYTKENLPLGDFSKSFTLEEGVKTVCIHLPWSVATSIKELSLDDNAFVKPIRLSKRIIVFGDSITQGYDALRPSKRYAARLAEAFGAEEINKGIGGEQFRPSLARASDAFEPDCIIVAYGTNDWSKSTEADFLHHCHGFFNALNVNYPKTRIFAIAPIWRKDCDQEKIFGNFDKVKELLMSITRQFPNIVCIDGYHFVPHDENNYADLRLHPNDAGFEHYYHNLFEEIKKVLL